MNTVVGGWVKTKGKSEEEKTEEKVTLSKDAPARKSASSRKKNGKASEGVNESEARRDEDWGGEGKEREQKTGADEDGEIETESNVELIEETFRVTEAAAQQTETAA